MNILPCMTTWYQLSFSSSAHSEQGFIHNFLLTLLFLINIIQFFKEMILKAKVLL